LNAAAYQVPYQHCHFLPDFTGYLHDSRTFEIAASRLMDYKQKLKGILPVGLRAYQWQAAIVNLRIRSNEPLTYVDGSGNFTSTVQYGSGLQPFNDFVFMSQGVALG
jgi:hypothetical protein